MKKKNVLFILTDQQRYDSLGCTGNSYAVTPNIDTLAQEGMSFSRHVVSNPTCMPSRASLMTGMTIVGHGVRSNGNALSRIHRDDMNLYKFAGKEMGFGDLPYMLPTMGDIFKNDGYNTAGFGKFHLEPHCSAKDHGFKEAYETWKDEEMEDYDGPFYGFDKVKMITSHGETPCLYNRGHYGRWLHKNHPKEAETVVSRESRIPVYKDVYMSKLPSELHHSMWLADEACNYIDSYDSEKPFLLYVGFPDPHAPYTAPEDIAKDFIDKDVLDPAPSEGMKDVKPKHLFDEMDERLMDREHAKYAAQITNASVSLVDKAVGQIIDKLKAEGLYDDTIIVFTSDHGDFLGDYGFCKKCNSAAHSLLHVPFVIKPAKDIDLPDVSYMQMSNVDVLPTLCSMLDISVPETVQGSDIFAVDEEEHKLFIAGYACHSQEKNFTVYDKKYRYTVYMLSGEEELYDHKSDPKELVNLAKDEKYSEMCKEFKQNTLEMLAKYDSCIPFKYSVF